MIHEDTLAAYRLDDDGCPPPIESTAYSCSYCGWPSRSTSACPHPGRDCANCSPVRSFKVVCWDQADKRNGYPGPGSSNALRFASAEEAEEYGRDLYSRWMGLARWEVQPSDEPVSYRMVNGHAYSLSSLEDHSNG